MAASNNYGWKPSKQNNILLEIKEEDSITM